MQNYKGTEKFPAEATRNEGMEVNKELLDNVLKAPEYQGIRLVTMGSYRTPAFMSGMAHMMHVMIFSFDGTKYVTEGGTKPHVYYQSNSKITTINSAVAKKLLEKPKRQDKPFVVEWNGKRDETAHFYGYTRPALAPEKQIDLPIFAVISGK
eukprot:1058199-Pleurochrysis_carterae.AAC.2